MNPNRYLIDVERNWNDIQNNYPTSDRHLAHLQLQALIAIAEELRNIENTLQHMTENTDD